MDDFIFRRRQKNSRTEPQSPTLSNIKNTLTTYNHPHVKNTCITIIRITLRFLNDNNKTNNSCRCSAHTDPRAHM